MAKKRTKGMSSSKIIFLGFLLIVLVGGILLSLPISSQTGEWTPFIESLFTAISATCVTGLIVHNTATHWSLFGQFIILLLIQIGGMGFMMVALSFFMLAGRRIGLVQRSIMVDTISAKSIGGIVGFTRFILKGLIIIEGTGAILLSFIFVPKYGLIRGIWYGIFHSISAFCNAGFDLCGVEQPFVSLTGYVTNPLMNIVVTGLIIIGGLGFLTWQDILHNKFRFKKYAMQTKVIVFMTLSLLSIAFIYFFAIEYRNLDLATRFWGSWFQAVTPRTAGFNTLDYGTMSEPGKMLSIILMLIGAAPGSTGGGMKVTTAGVMLFVTFAVFRQRKQVAIHRRSIEQVTIYHAATIFMIYVSFFLLGSMIICGVEHLPMIDCMFEVASAIGTVGLTTGITPTLCNISRIVLMILMFMGRVGGLTIIYAAIPQTYRESKYVNANISVG